MNSMINDSNTRILSHSNVSLAREFYQNKLGLDINFDLSKKGKIAFKVSNGGPELTLLIKPAILLTVDNVPQAYNALKQKGIDFLSQPFETLTGRAVEFIDPFGNKFGLTDYSKAQNFDR